MHMCSTKHIWRSRRRWHKQVIHMQHGEPEATYDRWSMNFNASANA